MQADTFFLANETAAGFVDILDRIEDRAAAFGRPVLLLQGDTHEYVEDAPFAGAPNVTRIVVRGSADAPGEEWLKLSVDPRSSAFFSGSGCRSGEPTQRGAQSSHVRPTAGSGAPTS